MVARTWAVAGVALLAAIPAAGCEALGDAAAAGDEIRREYGIEDPSFHLERAAGRTVLRVEGRDPGPVEEVGDPEGRLRGIAAIAAARFDLAAGDSVVVSLEAGEGSGAARTGLTLTGRFDAGELLPDDR